MRLFEQPGGIVKRPRRYRYSSLLGWLPGAHAIFFIGLGLSVFVWMVGGPSGHEWLGILPILWMFVGGFFDASIFLWRSIGLRLVARRLGLTFSRKSSQWWEPPPASYPVSISKTRNRLEGKFEGEPVVVFDAEVGWRSTSSDTCSRRRRGFSQRYFSVVELAAPPGTPRILIGGRWDSRFNSVPIAGTEYYLHGASREMRQDAAVFLSDELIEFLAENPKLVILTDGDRIWVYCTRWTSTHRQTPGNLPAFLEDALYLRSLIARQGDAQKPPNEGFIAKMDVEHGTWRRQTLWAQHRFVDPHPVRKMNLAGGTMTVRGRWNFGCLAVFGVVWTAGSAAALVASTDSVAQGLLKVFIGIGVLSALPGIIGLFVNFLRRPRGTLAEPTVRISGDYPLPGNELLVEFSQKNSSREALHDVRLTIEFARHVSEGENSKTPVGQRPYLVEQWEMTWPKQWHSSQSITLKSVEAGERLEMRCCFAVPANLPFELPEEQWWGLHVFTEVGGQREYTGTMRLPPTHLPNFSFYIPAVTLGAMFGAIGFFLGAMALLYLIFGGAIPSGVAVGCIVLTPVAFIGAGYAGYRLAKSSRDLPVVSNLYRYAKRVHPFLSVIGTMLALFVLLGGCILGTIVTWEAQRHSDDQHQSPSTTGGSQIESSAETDLHLDDRRKTFGPVVKTTATASIYF